MNSLTRIYLLRHAEVETRYQRVFGGRIDMDLSPRGHQQALALATYMRRFQLDAIYASPMKRVQQTLAPLLDQRTPLPVVIDELQEVDFGVWTGLTWEEVNIRHKMRASEWLDKLDQGAIPDAESAHDFRSRLEPCLRKILGEYSGQTVAVLCHGGVIRMLLSVLLDLPIRKMAGFEIDYASLTQVDCYPHRAEIQMLNFTPWRDLA
jgi:broad specificity phosphatase PhoE